MAEASRLWQRTDKTFSFEKLATEKILHFVDLERLESLANEDKWMEFNDINLGSWSAQNLRTMAIEARVKDVYDCYYDLCSGYTHGHWSAIRDSAFVTCFNPLHRFHRIPSPINFGMRSILSDGVVLINRMLNDLSNIYPGMTDRILLRSAKSKKRAKKPRGSDEARTVDS